MNDRQHTPKHCLHKPSGLGYVRLNGKCHYTAKWGTQEADRRYDKLLATWLANGRVMPSEGPQDGYWVRDLVADYLVFASSYYRKNGEPTKEIVNIRYAVKPLLGLFGDEAAAEFGPKRLKTYREALIAKDLCRTLINQRVGIIKRMFTWGASEEKVAGEVAAALRSVAGLKFGRSRARETAPVTPVTEADFRAALEQMGTSVAGMARLQWLTGMRPGEVVQMRWRDVDVRGEPWLYRPRTHKTQHHGRSRVIPLGPAARAILGERRTLDRSSPIFPTCGDAANGSMGQYSTVTYRRAITRACDRAGVPRWTPNQLRHSAATRIRSAFGLDTARALLGHSSAAVTEVYAERDVKKAQQAMEEAG